MKKINTVLFRDDTDHYYIGTKADNKIIGFTLLSPLSDTSRQAIKSMKDPLNLNDFLVITLSQTKKNVKITPLTCGTVYLKGDEKDAEAIAAVLYDINREDLINLFNTLVDPKLLVDPVKKLKKVKTK